ncbi:hypothetical protein B5K05_03990 [Rhizobium phaseoli]|uniref:hypothetical protein n=1 Tax=Rhizobium phaseoli TaxID=396 RepID=UPI000E0D5060|nr:hypothetical protein [Rhizobium phaseoli]RDJ17406.1 hypothetical protein B5K04_03970 [Rhizobium phaseoli]RDJ18922.1 hypothetical protein B5K05_03990 [Rhizobium phaseoli]
MRGLPQLVALALIASTSGHANAWDRDTVERQISKLCEQRNPDDWPSQDDCIAMQRRALQSLRPPRGDVDVLAAYQGCKSAAASEYDFAAILQCFQVKLAVLNKARAEAAEIAENAELASEFPKLPIIVQCSFSDGRKIDIRRGSKQPGAVVVKFSPERLLTGKSGVGYSYEWGGAQGSDYRLDGNQLMDRSGGPVKLFMGQCQYR